MADTATNGRDIIVIGASAGGVQALRELIGSLPKDLPAAIFVVLHLPAGSSSNLPSILERAGPFPAIHPEDGAPIEHGTIYVAPPDRHLLVKRGHVRLPRGPKENGVRPAADPLFRTAARAYGPRVVGILLSGTLDDGTAGLKEVKLRGGTVLVADPEEADYTGMLRSAIDNVAVDRIASLAEMGAIVDELTREPIPEGGAQVPEEMDMGLDVTEIDRALQGEPIPGVPTGYTCPDCGGVLWEVREADANRFRCRVGHGYSPESLLARGSDKLEEALWAALQELEQRAALLGRMAARMRQRGNKASAARFEEHTRDALARAALVRRALLPEESVKSSTAAEAELELRESGDEDGRETGAHA